MRIKLSWFVYVMQTSYHTFEFSRMLHLCSSKKLRKQELCLAQKVVCLPSCLPGLLKASGNYWLHYVSLLVIQMTWASVFQWISASEGHWVLSQGSENVNKAAWLRISWGGLLAYKPIGTELKLPLGLAVHALLENGLELSTLPLHSKLRPAYWGFEKQQDRP